MSIIDRQRITAVRSLETLGYVFDGLQWQPPSVALASGSVEQEADAMHSLLVLRADKLEGCTESSEDATELKLIGDALDAYEVKRWPDGMVHGRKAG